VSEEQLEELGPIDFVVLEWPGDQPPPGKVGALLRAAVQRQGN
jgi:hypothetical protein